MRHTPVDAMSTYPFQVFWSWLMLHPNCILRAGTAEAVLYDDDDLHWHFAADGATVYVQIIRGKRLMGELAIDTDRVSYAQYGGEDREGEHLFELVAENEAENSALHFFVVSHGFDSDDEVPAHERAVH